MEEVLAQFQSTAINPENDQTSFDGLYKNWGRFGQQEKRRKDILDNQKKNRNVKMDTSRGIIDIVSSIEKGNNDRYRPSIYVAGFTKTSLTYENVLMHSEWLIEKPEDFETNWVVVPCPKGVRTLVVAHQGNTRCYTKHGYFRLGCHTALPCGNPQDSYNSSQCVVLDCFYVELINKMYVLDVLAWKSQPMTDGETEFRHYWLKSQIEEIPELKTVNDKNKIIFELLPKVSCKPDSFNEFMMKVPHFENFTPQLDGLLFYHQKANYISGETPLVGWLFPYMVNEVLGPEITVHPAYLKEKPTDYVNQAQFIRNFDYNIKKRQSARRKKAVKIEECNEMEQSEINEIVQSEPNANSETAEGFLMDSDKDVEWKSEMSTNNGHFTSMTPVDGS